MRYPKAQVPRIAVAVVVVLCSVAPASSDPPAPAPGSSSGRTVAVADIHGELEGFREILKTAELIDEAGRWNGGSATLVQLGDYLDRGPDVRAVMDLLMRLQTEAREAGGEVVVLLGNHEQMNLLTLYDDVSPAALEAFTDDRSESRRRRAYEDWLRWKTGRTDPGGEDRGPPPDAAEVRHRWMEAHPPGWIEYHEALGPEGTYGEWIRERPVATVRGGVLFMHAGLSPEYADRPVEEINRLHTEAFQGFDRVRRYLVEKDLAPAVATYGELRRTLVELGGGEETAPTVPPAILGSLGRDFDGVRWTMEPESPLWFRGYARWPDEELRPLVDRILGTHEVERLAAGHSPLESASIHTRLGNRVLLLDTGMLTARYGGQASALEIDGGRITGIYPDEREVLVGERYAPPPRVFRTPDGDPLPLGREGVLTLLRRGSVVDARPLGEGVSRASILVLEAGGQRLRAVFHDIDMSSRKPVQLGRKTALFFVDSYRSQVAAYELSRLMGLDRVPPTVKRIVLGRVGSAQLWIENATTWKEIRKAEAQIPEPAYVRRQLYDLRVFDNLIHNTDRNLGNILFDPDWNLWWIDNTRSFSLHRELVAPDLVERCSRGLWRDLHSMDEEAVHERLRPYVSRAEIKALFTRRDLLIALLEERIAELGEDRVLFGYDDPPGGDSLSQLSPPESVARVHAASTRSQDQGVEP